MTDNKKEHFYIQHLIDLANRAYQNGYPIFTDFMTTKEASLCHQSHKFFSNVEVLYWGGHSDCSHVIGGFFPFEYIETEDKTELFPVSCIQVTCSNEKYAKDISHRDYLGAILNLGIQRSMIGDIRISNQSAYVFCKKELASFIIDNFSMVKHTAVQCRLIKNTDELPPQEYDIINKTVSSLRLDNMVAAMVGCARGKASQLITQGHVIVAGEERNSVSYRCSSDSIITIRGFGKYKWKTDEDNMTKKGRYKIIIYKYL